MGVVAAESGGDDLAEISLAVAVSILEKENIGRIGDPDSTVADGDSRGDIESLREDGETIGLAVTVGILEDLDPIAARAGLRRGYSRLSVIQTRPRSSKVIATGLTMSGSAATTST